MRLRHRRSPLLLLLLPSLAASAVIASSSGDSKLDRDAPAAANVYRSESIADSSTSAKKYDVGTKDAPVDGKDGKPHEGPFVDYEPKSSDPTKELPTMKGRPVDPTVIDGKKIPESNDGVMDDKNRPGPKQGTTGTGGGVSEKDKERKKKEGTTGEKVENRPQTPKEAPPLPHSDQEKILREKEGKDSKDKSKSSGKASEDVSGLEKPSDLPGKTHDKSPPLPDSANKDHLDVSKGAKSGKNAKIPDDGNEGLIQPFHSFVLSLTMILFSEIGDKTFLVAALMAMKHDRLVVFSAALSALITMTVLSAVLGHAVPSLIPKRLTNYLAAGLFLVFGGRLLREGLAMSPDEGVSAEMQEVEMELEEKEKENLARKQGRRRSSVSPYTLEMGLGSRKSRSKSRFPTPPRSPSTSPDGRSPSPRRGMLTGCLSGLNNLLSLLLSPAWVQTFVMTFLGEWGDRSQIATIAMAAGQDYWWVTLGAVLGHACCTGVAVVGGRAIAGRVSLKVVTVGGAVAFLLFGFIYFVEAFYT
ncbi:putative transmembrane protein pft27 protein [Diplogelasinospora grovesii]|uniref:Transmembrane protein pft27 protein n=1 Tax=Diplogelasinospora grovesii TaxID=303347 RepID=A0AAN6N9Z1_9PEZI|nr:putative transmembrane protein pft27 protein [Diplogelasinospora grovesii]